MHIVFHIGMHCTDEDMALRCLLRNGAALADEGSVISLPVRFKPVLRDAMIELRGAKAPPDLQDKMKAALIDAPDIHRVLFSNDNFVCPPARAVIGPRLYPLAEERLPWMRNLFPDDTVEFAFGLRNPVTLLPALHARAAKDESLETYLERVEPERLSWARTVAAMIEAVPDARLTVWCNEETPLIWPEVLGALSGSAAPLDLKGAHDFLGKIMTPVGLSRYIAYIQSNPPKSVGHRYKVTSAFLGKFARPEMVEMEVPMPDWSSEKIAALTARYEADVAAIKAMEQVRFLSV